MTESADEPALWIETDRYGVIGDFSPAAVTLLGYSARAMRGRALPLMFSKKRPTYLDLKQAWRGEPVQRDAVINPRNRRGLSVWYRIELRTSSCDSALVLRWTFERV